MGVALFRALRHRNFALFASGQVFALIGYWMQTLAQSWLLYRLSGSATLLGVLGFASSVPIFLLAPVAGLLSDRVNLHRAMFAVQVLEMLQAITMAVLAVTGLIESWHIVTLACIMGVLVAFELPLRHAYLIELVGGKEDLPNAVALTSLIANTGRLLGPAVAGLVIAHYGESLCFVVNALTFVGVIITFAMIRVVASPRADSHPPFVQGLVDGFRYAWDAIPIRMLLAMLVVVSLFATPYMTLMPVLVREVFASGANVMGLLVGSAGLGGVAGTVFLAARPHARGLVTVIAAASAAAGTALALVSWAGAIGTAVPLLTVVGFGILVTSVSVNMILQTIVADDKRGRVMSLYTAAFLGMSPFGAVIAGALADQIGVKATLTAGGVICTVAGAYLASQRHRLRKLITFDEARLNAAA